MYGNGAMICMQDKIVDHRPILKQLLVHIVCIVAVVGTIAKEFVELLIDDINQKKMSWIILVSVLLFSVIIIIENCKLKQTIN